MTLSKQCLASSTVTVFTHANALSIDVNGNGEVALGVTAINYGGVRCCCKAEMSCGLQS